MDSARDAMTIEFSDARDASQSCRAELPTLPLVWRTALPLPSELCGLSLPRLRTPMGGRTRGGRVAAGTRTRPPGDMIDEDGIVLRVEVVRFAFDGRAECEMMISEE